MSRSVPFMLLLLLLGGLGLASGCGGQEDEFPVVMAADKGDWGRVFELIDAGRDVDEQGPGGLTALQVAVMNGANRAVVDLLDRGAAPDLMQDDGRTALHMAATAGNLPALRALAEHGGDVNLKNRRGLTPAAIALQYGHRRAAQLLGELGGQVRWGQAMASRALDLARVGDAEGVARLLDQGLDPNVTVGGTPLLCKAVTFCQPTVVRLLLQRGANPDGRNGRGMRALHVTAFNDRADIAELLAAAGADVNARDNEGVMPLTVAKARRNLAVAAVLEAYGAANCWAGLRGGELLDAAERGDAEELKVLIQGGAHAGLVGPQLVTPLHLAAVGNHADAVRVLIEAGAATDAQLSQGQAPLHLAARQGHIEAATALLDAGAEVNAADAKGRTALEVAKEFGQEAMVAFLKKRGGRSYTTPTDESGADRVEGLQDPFGW